MVGAIPTNLHEGSRSEYLAQYVFASFGTVIPVPHQEDSGIDLYCTLVERVGRLAWPRAYFTVQVKSTLDPWIFTGEASVRWLIEHPLPLLLCVVDKASARIRVYHTSPRFYVWSLPPPPTRLRLVPETIQIGRATQWLLDTKAGDEWTFSLSAPILDFSVTDSLEDGFHYRAKQVLEMWLDADQRNLLRVKAGIYSFTMPDYYETNSTKFRGLATQWIIDAPWEKLAQSKDHLKDLLSWLQSQLRRKGDITGATLGAMLLRHLGDDSGGDMALQNLINAAVGKENYVFAGVDELNRIIQEKIKPKEAET